ncbi:MAG: glycerate kinase, partial [candidate division NC10 bacterium]
MSTILRYLEFLSLGTWVGSILFLSFVVAPGAFALLSDGSAVVEMARASGIARLGGRRLDPLAATSYGTGQLIAA